MYRRTFEVFSKFIAEQNNVTINFDTNGEAYADLEGNVLHLPSDIANDNAHGALALTMHEAAHVRYSKDIPIKQICPMKSDFFILNAIEDVRIDRKNFSLLPNVIGFYEELVKKHMDVTDKKAPEAARRLCGAILLAEGFQPKMLKEDQDAVYNLGIIEKINKGTQFIERKDWNNVKKTVEEIKKLLKIDPSKDVPNTTMSIGVGVGKKSDKNQGQGQGTGKDGKNGEGQAAQEGCGLEGMEDMLRPGSVWGTGPRMPGGSSDVTSPLAMEEQCAQQFKEILNVKEVKILKDGAILDTDNLTAFLTGDIEGLFKEEVTERKKKSKVFFLIDCSGSMGDALLDGKSRIRVVKSCVQKLTEILDEVQSLEGLNVDWEVGMFSDNYQRMTKDNWQGNYYSSGGTRFAIGFEGAMNDMLQDYTIEGKRIIVVFTDGDVDPSDVDYVNKKIVECHRDVRSLVIGVGSQINGKFVKELVGDNIIIAEANATEIIMETIKAML